MADEIRTVKTRKGEKAHEWEGKKGRERKT
jgi:hypothetical protein